MYFFPLQRISYLIVYSTFFVAPALQFSGIEGTTVKTKAVV